MIFFFFSYVPPESNAPPYCDRQLLHTHFSNTPLLSPSATAEPPYERADSLWKLQRVKVGFEVSVSQTEPPFWGDVRGRGECVLRCGLCGW